MPVTADSPAPYAPATAVLAIVERHRNKGLPPVIDTDVLARAGVPETLGPRTMHALRSLDLITEDGKLTDVIEGLRLAPEPEYKQRMADWLRATYADVLTFVDPETATEGQLRDAFRTYKPIGQQSRMVTLFQLLFAAAGLAPERERQAPRRTPANSAPKSKVQGMRILKSVTSGAATPAGAAKHQRQSDPQGFPPALSGLLADLPPPGSGWTQKRRDSFMTAFSVILDYCYPIEAEVEQTDVNNESEGEDTPV